ncbi:MAG: sensor histidine kinase [Desulfovibrionales bacterium]
MFHPGKNSLQILLIAVLVLGITLLHFLTRHGQIYYHIFYLDLYFLPLIMAGLWYGLRGAVITAVAITILYFPYILWRWQGFSPDDFDRIVQLLLINAIAVVLGIVSDRQKREEKALRESESMTAMGRGVSFLAHDLKTPLMAIGGMANLLRKKKPAEDPEMEKLDIIAAEAQRMEFMVRDMLVFSKPLSLDLVEGDINELVGRCLPVACEAARERGVTVQDELDHDLPPVRFDPLRLEQALINLLLNAVQASAKGGVVTVRTQQEDAHVAVTIRDTGPGIPQDVRTKIFDPFFTTKPEGTGLGLPIVKKVMEAHNGGLDLRNHPDGGTVAAVKLPRS